MRTRRCRRECRHSRGESDLEVARELTEVAVTKRPETRRERNQRTHQPERRARADEDPGAVETALDPQLVVGEGLLVSAVSEAAARSITARSVRGPGAARAIATLPTASSIARPAIRSTENAPGRTRRQASVAIRPSSTRAARAAGSHNVDGHAERAGDSESALLVVSAPTIIA